MRRGGRLRAPSSCPGPGGAAARYNRVSAPHRAPEPPRMFSRADTIAAFDPEPAKAIASENRRQEDHVELIASENYASPRVMEAQGSQLTNKYAEGYP